MNAQRNLILNNVFHIQIAYQDLFFSVKLWPFFKLKNDFVDDNNGPVHHCAIFDNNHECNAAAEKLIRLPTDKSHADNENDVTFYDVTDNSSGNCKSNQNYASVTNSCKTGVNQCNNSLGYRNCVDCDKFFVNSNYKNSSNSFCCNQIPVNQSPGLPQIFGYASIIVNTIETENPNVSNNLPDIDAELDYNDLFSMPSDYYDDHSLINNLLCSKNKSNHLFMVHFNVRSLQKNIDKLSHYLTDLNRKPDVVAVSETKLKENMIYSNIELDGYQFIHRNSYTSAGGVGIYVKSSISHNLKPTINIDLPLVENLWIEIEINKKN